MVFPLPVHRLQVKYVRVVPAGTDDPSLPALARRAARRIGVFVAETT
jgi:hypothetical protein